MKTLKEIKEIIIKNKKRLLIKYPIRAIAIFGSYSRNEQNKRSDLDIMVEFNGDIGIRFIDLADELEELLGLKLDVVSKNGIKERYYQQIKSELIYV
ncbi:MAG: nucleotidyltransferase domain-containing protein [Ignavibacteriales bacterium]|nr:nucleotidyltransferase domain-containing protein [Ignavibacteriales bacterium]